MLRISKIALVASLLAGPISARAQANGSAPACTAIDDATTYDYIVVGSGPAGMVVADRLSEANHSVLLIERGPPSFGRWMPPSADLLSVPDDLPLDNWRPGWLDGTNLTRFDVPGLAQRIYSDGAHVNCSDVEGPLVAGCLLGGGMAVNAALWWRPPAADWDENFAPVAPGWSADDMRAAADAVFARVPGTDRPSADGLLSSPGLDGGWAPVARALAASGWREVRANDEPDDKDGTFSYPNFSIEAGQRGGAHASYLASASRRAHFRLVTNTMVRRVVRDGARATGVEVEPSATGAADGSGLCAGVVRVAPGRGRVVLSGGYLGTAKVLFRSGIGPESQLRVVQAAEGSGGVGDESRWLRLPVGEGLRDHTVTALQLSHPDVRHYDFSSDAAYFSPPAEQRERYLTNRTGMLTVTGAYQAPVSWMVVNGSDGAPRQIQTTCRVYGATSTSMTCSQFLTRGSTSSGTLTITPGLRMNISAAPYAATAGDRAAIVRGMEAFLAALRANPEITITQPPENVTVEDYVENYPQDIASRRGIHYMGTAKMGTDSGLAGGGGTSVVDPDARVYGTENLFVVDASIMPGLTASNPSAAIMCVAERASQRILALDAGVTAG